MKNDITIHLASINSNVLDNSVRDLLKAIPENEYAFVTLEVLPAEVVEVGRLLARKVTFSETTNKVAVFLAKVDVPHDVNISIR